MSALMNPLPAVPTLAPGVPGVVGRYRLQTWLGSGSMGIVHRALDPELERPVALKLLRPDIRQRTDVTGGVDRGVARERFAQEARAMAAIVHPNVLKVFDAGADGPWAYLTMELVDGPSLTAWLETPRSWSEILAMFVQAGRGLAAAHAHGIVHRDFKPDNVLIAPDPSHRQGIAKVMDFGLATQVGHQPSLEVTAQIQIGGESFEPTLTQSGMSVGTPAFMAPEQHFGDVVDGRADQFAFCSTLWEALSGARPWQGRDAHALARAKQQGAMVVGPVEVPRSVASILRRGMGADPDDRYPSMGMLLDALEKAARRRRITRALLPFAG